jgi:hypothetical protein
MSGKGSGRRPQQESDETVAARWEAIFPKGKTPEPETKEKEQDDEQ